MRRPAVLSRARFAVLVLLAYLATSCGGGGTTEPPGPDSLDATGATALNGSTGAQVGPLEVRLTDDDGDPRSGVNVLWAVTSGSGTLSATSTPTNADGRASVTWTLGPAAGAHTVTATVQGLDPITFTATVTFQTLEPTVNISMSGNHSVDRIIIPAGVTVTITGPTTLEVEGEVQILGTLTGNCHALTVIGSGAGTIAGTIANHCVAGGAIGGDLEFTVDGPLSVTGTIRSGGNVLIRNTPDIDEADLDVIFASPPRAAPALQVGGADDCGWDAATFVGPDGIPVKAPLGIAGADAPNFTAICSGDAILNEPDFDMNGEGQAGGDAPAPDAGPGPASESGGNGGAGPDFTYYTAGDLTINPDGSGILRLARGGDGGDADVVASAPGQSAVAVGGDGGNGGGMRIGAGGGITIANTLTIVTGGGGHGGNARAVGAKGNDGATAASQPGGDATANGGNGGHTTQGRLNAEGAVGGLFNIVLDDGGNYGDGGNGGDATAIAGQGGHGGAFDINGAIGGDMIAGGGDGGDVRTQGFSGAFVGDAGNGGDITVGGAGGGSPAPRLNVGPVRAPSMGGNGVDRCNPIMEGGDGGGGGSVLSNATRAKPSQPGEGGEGGPGVTSDGDDGAIEVLDETGVGGDGGDGDPVGDGGAEGDDGGLGAGFTRVNGSPIFEPGDPGMPCPLPNTPPVLQEASATTPKNTPVGVTLPYTDGENDLPNANSATVNNITPAGSGTVTNFQVTTIPGPPVGTGLRLTFTPATDFVGTATFQVSVNDARGALSNVVTVTVNVTDTSPAVLRDARIEFNSITFPITPGVARTLPVTDVATGLQLGTMQVRPVGQTNEHFVSTNPATGGDRVGLAGRPGNRWEALTGTLDVPGDSNASVEEIELCFINTSGVGAGTPIAISFTGAAVSPPARGSGPLESPAQVPPPTTATGNGCLSPFDISDVIAVLIALEFIGTQYDMLEFYIVVSTSAAPTAG